MYKILFLGKQFTAKDLRRLSIYNTYGFTPPFKIYLFQKSGNPNALEYN